MRVEEEIKALTQWLGSVKKGQQYARQLGIPTANLSLPSKISLTAGVYVATALYQGQEQKGIGYVRPELDLFEIHLFGFNQTIYGETLSINVLKKIREHLNFNNEADLKAQLKLDCEEVQKWFIEESWSLQSSNRNNERKSWYKM